MYTIDLPRRNGKTTKARQLSMHPIFEDRGLTIHVDERARTRFNGIILSAVWPNVPSQLPTALIVDEPNHMDENIKEYCNMVVNNGGVVFLFGTDMEEFLSGIQHVALYHI